MHYGVTGFLIAKDILHLILPDSKKTEMKPTFNFCQCSYSLTAWIPAVVVYSYSATVHTVGECVWTHYLAVTEKEERGGALSLSAVQQQEVWLQYSALQIALQVSSHLHTFVSARKAFWSIQVLSFLRLITKVWKPTQVTLQFQDYHTSICSSELFLRYSPSIIISLSK